MLLGLIIALFIFFGERENPVILTDLQNAINNIDDINTVGCDQWIYRFISCHFRWKRVTGIIVKVLQMIKINNRVFRDITMKGNKQ